MDIRLRFQIYSGKVSCCLRLWILVIAFMLPVAGCASHRHLNSALPPVMELDEAQRPYVKLGELYYSRDRFGSVEGISSEDREWAISELREAAGRLGADAVIFPEIRFEQNTFIIFPIGQIKAKGIAIRFR